MSFLLERDYGIKMPRKLQIEFSRVIQQITDATGREITSAEIWRAFKAEYIDQQAPLAIRDHSEHSAGESGQLTATVSDGSAERTIFGEGNGPIDAFVHALNKDFDLGSGSSTTTSTRLEAAPTPPQSASSNCAPAKVTPSWASACIATS